MRRLEMVGTGLLHPGCDFLAESVYGTDGDILFSIEIIRISPGITATQIRRFQLCEAAMTQNVNEFHSARHTVEYQRD
jgi:hypothetical protein